MEMSSAFLQNFTETILGPLLPKVPIHTQREVGVNDILPFIQMSLMMAILLMLSICLACFHCTMRHSSCKKKKCSGDVEEGHLRRHRLGNRQQPEKSLEDDADDDDDDDDDDCRKRNCFTYDTETDCIRNFTCSKCVIKQRIDTDIVSEMK